METVPVFLRCIYIDCAAILRYDDIMGGGMSSKKIAWFLSVVCALAFVFFPASCTVKSSEKTAQEATDALAMPFAPIDFDKAEAANERVPQKEAEEKKQ